MKGLRLRQAADPEALPNGGYGLIDGRWWCRTPAGSLVAVRSRVLVFVDGAITVEGAIREGDGTEWFLSAGEWAQGR